MNFMWNKINTLMRHVNAGHLGFKFLIDVLGLSHLWFQEIYAKKFSYSRKGIHWNVNRLFGKWIKRHVYLTRYRSSVKVTYLIVNLFKKEKVPRPQKQIETASCEITNCNSVNILKKYKEHLENWRKLI
jgi:hypothetical protein